MRVLGIWLALWWCLELIAAPSRAAVGLLVIVSLMVDSLMAGLSDLRRASGTWDKRPSTQDR